LPGRWRSLHRNPVHINPSQSKIKLTMNFILKKMLIYNELTYV